MKKTLTVLIAAGALLGAPGCSAAPPMSTEETCARIQSIGAGPSSNTDKTGMIRLANRVRPIEVTASQELKEPLNAIIEYLDESAKPSPNTERLAELQGASTEAQRTINEVCGAGGQ